MSRGRGFRRNLSNLKIPARPGGLGGTGGISGLGGTSGGSSSASSRESLTPEFSQPQYSDYMVLEESKGIVSQITNYTLASHPDVLRMCNTIRKYGETFDRMRKDDMDKIFDGFRDAIRNPATHPSIRVYLLELVESRARQWTGQTHLAFYEKRKKEFMVGQNGLTKSDRSDVLLVDLDKIKPQFHPDRLTHKYSLHFTCPNSLLDQNRTTMTAIEHRTRTKISVERGPFGDVLNSSVKIWGTSLNNIKNAARMINEEVVGFGCSTPATAPPTMSGDRESPFTFSEPLLCEAIETRATISSHPDRAPPMKVRRHLSTPAPQTFFPSDRLPTPTSADGQFEAAPESANRKPVFPEPTNRKEAPSEMPKATNHESRSDRRRSAPVPLAEAPPTLRLTRKDLAPVQTSSKQIQTDFMDQIVLRGLSCESETGDVVIISGNPALLKNLQAKLLNDLKCSGYEQMTKRQISKAVCQSTPATVTTLREPLHPSSTSGEFLSASRVSDDAAKRRGLFVDKRRRRRQESSSGGALEYDRETLLSVARTGCAHRRPESWDVIAPPMSDVCKPSVTKLETAARLDMFERWSANRLQPSPLQPSTFERPSFAEVTSRFAFPDGKPTQSNFNFSGREASSGFSFSGREASSFSGREASSFSGNRTPGSYARSESKSYVIPIRRSPVDTPSRWSPTEPSPLDRNSPVDRVKSPPGFVTIPENNTSNNNNDNKSGATTPSANHRGGNPFSIATFGDKSDATPSPFSRANTILKQRQSNGEQPAFTRSFGTETSEPSPFVKYARTASSNVTSDLANFR